MRKLIMIAGVPRSGTTWVMANCGLHPWTEGDFAFNESGAALEVASCCPGQRPNWESLRSALCRLSAATAGMVCLKRPWCGWLLPIVRQACWDIGVPFSGLWCLRDPVENALSQLSHPGASRPLHRATCNNWDPVGRMAEFAVKDEEWESWSPLQRGVHYWFLGNAEAVLAVRETTDIHVMHFGETGWPDIERMCDLPPSPRLNHFRPTTVCSDRHREEASELVVRSVGTLKELAIENGSQEFWGWRRFDG